MAAASFAAGDWGTSHLRLFLCEPDGTVLESADGPGAAAAGGRFASILEELLAPWRQRHGPLPAVLCGMVGSSIGWIEAPYVACPVRPEAIAGRCVSPGGAVYVVPGLSCRNRFDAPDFLRGEETQILGALACDCALRRGRHLLCLPGTHTKWVVLQDGAVSEFLSAPAGELYGLLRDHSILVGDHAGPAGLAGAFEQGLMQFNRFPEAQLLHRLFECRARRLSGELAPQDAAAYLSGLLIASDVGGALGGLRDALSAGTVHLIGAGDLMALYARALAAHDCAATQLEGTRASLVGLAHLHSQLTARPVKHAAH
ncbi:MAG TPA: 2-dehydro-3-deoxygalactonokinase [Steroidobacteraceae bacterium]